MGMETDFAITVEIDERIDVYKNMHTDIQTGRQCINILDGSKKCIKMHHPQSIVRVRKSDIY
jgi:hypothetical protein